MVPHRGQDKSAIRSSHEDKSGLAASNLKLAGRVANAYSVFLNVSSQDKLAAHGMQLSCLGLRLIGSRLSVTPDSTNFGFYHTMVRP